MRLDVRDERIYQVTLELELQYIRIPSVVYREALERQKTVNLLPKPERERAITSITEND